MKLSIRSKLRSLWLNDERFRLLDIPTVAHGHSSSYSRRTGHPGVVQYSMLDVSCPSGNYSTISSFDRLQRSASSRYKKYPKNLVFRHQKAKDRSQVSSTRKSIQSWQWSISTVKPTICFIVTKCQSSLLRWKEQEMGSKQCWSMPQPLPSHSVVHQLVRSPSLSLCLWKFEPISLC